MCDHKTMSLLTLKAYRSINAYHRFHWTAKSIICHDHWYGTCHRKKKKVTSYFTPKPGILNVIRCDFFLNNCIIIMWVFRLCPIQWKCCTSEHIMSTALRIDECLYRGKFLWDATLLDGSMNQKNESFKYKQQYIAKTRPFFL